MNSQNALQSPPPGPERKSPKIGQRLSTISKIVSQTHNPQPHLNQNELNKLKRFQGQIDHIKGKVKQHVEQHSDRQKDHNSFTLNINTDSEDEGTQESQVNTSRPVKENNQQKGYLEAQMTRGAEQTNAKENTKILFSNFDKASQLLPAKMNLKKIFSTNEPKNINTLSSPTAHQQSIGQQATSVNLQPQATLLNQGTSTSGQPNQTTKISNSIGLNNSYYEDTLNNAGEDNMCYLKGLTQNQNLPNNCELTEFVENDKITIGIKTTDFFTFVRLQDEVDELRRKHNEFQLQKQLIQQKSNEQNILYNKQSYYDAFEGYSPSHSNNQKLNGSMSVKNSNTLNQKLQKQSPFSSSQYNKFINAANIVDPAKKEGSKIFSFYVARKYGLKWHKKMAKIQKERKQSLQLEMQNLQVEDEVNQLNQSMSSYQSDNSSIDDNQIKQDQD